MKHKLSTFKKLTIMLIAILSIFGCYNLVWFVTKYYPYHKFCVNMQSNSNEGISKYYLKDADFTYSVKMPAYLGFGGGFLNVSNNEPPRIMVNADDENKPSAIVADNVSVSLFAWPKFVKETQYGVMIIEGSRMTQLFINENLDYVPFDYETSAEISEHEQIIVNYHQQIDELMKAMQIMWGDLL